MSGNAKQTYAILKIILFIAMFKRVRLRIRNRNIHAIIVGFAIIMFWRGLWGLMDRYLFPDNPDLSFLTSIFLGLLILLVVDLSLEELE